MTELTEDQLEKAFDELGGQTLHCYEDPGSGVKMLSVEGRKVLLQICAGNESSGIPPQLILHIGNVAQVFVLEPDTELTQIEEDIMSRNIEIACNT